jgi:hypothetical protein
MRHSDTLAIKPPTVTASPAELFPDASKYPVNIAMKAVSGSKSTNTDAWEVRRAETTNSRGETKRVYRYGVLRKVVTSDSPGLPRDHALPMCARRGSGFEIIHGISTCMSNCTKDKPRNSVPSQPDCQWVRVGTFPKCRTQSDEGPLSREYTRYRPSGEIVGSSRKSPASGKRVTGCANPPSAGMR